MGGDSELQASVVSEARSATEDISKQSPRPSSKRKIGNKKKTKSSMIRTLLIPETRMTGRRMILRIQVTVSQRRISKTKLCACSLENAIDPQVGRYVEDTGRSAVDTGC